MTTEELAREAGLIPEGVYELVVLDRFHRLVRNETLEEAAAAIADIVSYDIEAEMCADAIRALKT